MDITLVIMAAGMGSRFGGLKQITPITDDGKIIMDFSIIDAYKAGFTKVVFVIKKEFLDEFKNSIGNKVEKFMKVSYAFQSIDNLPIAQNINREKPFGTAHAVYCAKDFVNEPFCVINADDFYGYDAFMKIAQHLKSGVDDYALVSYKLENTLTENGYVSRGICSYNNGYLENIIEKTSIEKIDNVIKYFENGLPYILSDETYVSMNMWGFNLDFFAFLEKGLLEFLKTAANIETDEYYIPYAVDTLIKSGEKRVKFLKTDAQWIGITYKDDMDNAKLAIKKLIENGAYNEI